MILNRAVCSIGRVEKLERATMNCQQCQSALADLLLDPASPSNAAARVHLAGCVDCKEEFRSLEATFALLDSWEAPKPSPYFDQKLAILLREEESRPPAGWVEQLRSRFRFNTGRQLKPALAGAMALILLVGGGTIANLSRFAPPTNEVSAAVQDLQILDKNDQALQTMDQLLQDDSTADETSAPPSS